MKRESLITDLYVNDGYIYVEYAYDKGRVAKYHYTKEQFEVFYNQVNEQVSEIKEDISFKVPKYMSHLSGTLGFLGMLLLEFSFVSAMLHTSIVASDIYLAVTSIALLSPLSLVYLYYDSIKPKASYSNVVINALMNVLESDMSKVKDDDRIDYYNSCLDCIDELDLDKVKGYIDIPELGKIDKMVIVKMLKVLYERKFSNTSKIDVTNSDGISYDFARTLEENDRMYDSTFGLVQCDGEGTTDIMEENNTVVGNKSNDIACPRLIFINVQPGIFGDLGEINSNHLNDNNGSNYVYVPVDRGNNPLNSKRVTCDLSKMQIIYIHSGDSFYDEIARINYCNLQNEINYLYVPTVSKSKTLTRKK